MLCFLIGELLKRSSKDNMCVLSNIGFLYIRTGSANWGSVVAAIAADKIAFHRY